MQYRSVKGYTGWSQLAMLLLFTGLGILMAGLVQVIIGSQLIEGNLTATAKAEAIGKALLKPENVLFARISQIAGTFLIMCLPVLMYWKICFGKHFFWLGFNSHINYKQVALGFFLIFLANTIAAPLSELTRSVLVHFPSINETALEMERDYKNQVAALSNLKSWGEFCIAVITMAFFPAVFEELFFRGALQQLFERWWKKPLLAVLVASVIFSMIHMSIFLFLSRVVLGIVLGLMFQRSRNIWVNIIAHFLNNVVVLLQMVWLNNNKDKISPEKINAGLPAWSAFVALGITVALIYLFDKVSEKNRTQIAFQEQNLLDQQGGHPHSLA